MRPTVPWIAALLVATSAAAAEPLAVKVSFSHEHDHLLLLGRSDPFPKAFAPEPALSPNQRPANSWSELRDRAGQVKLRRSIPVLPEGKFGFDTPYLEDAPILAVLTRDRDGAAPRELTRIDLSPPLRIPATGTTVGALSEAIAAAARQAGLTGACAFVWGDGVPLWTRPVRIEWIEGSLSGAVACNQQLTFSMEGATKMAVLHWERDHFTISHPSGPGRHPLSVAQGDSLLMDFTDWSSSKGEPAPAVLRGLVEAKGVTYCGLWPLPTK